MSSRTFKIDTSPYGEDIQLFNSNRITIHPGVTVLVGCNGAGKTTLFKLLKSQLEDANIPIVSFDNLTEGGTTSMSGALASGDYNFLSSSWNASEGERISLNLGKFASSLRDFIKTGKSPDIKKGLWDKIFGDDGDENPTIPEERWIFLDSIDSGLSIDNMTNLQDLFELILSDTPSKINTYILVTANAYELARNNKCFDVIHGEYTEFKDYEDYRNFILDSYEAKSKRYEENEE